MDDRVKHTCRWIKRPASSTQTAIYCDAPVGYTNPIHPDSGQRERKYKDFCTEHEALASEDDDDVYG